MAALPPHPDRDPLNPAASTVVFQYNPDQVRRTLANRTQQQTPGGGGTQGAREDVLRVAGPPVEAPDGTATFFTGYDFWSDGRFFASANDGSQRPYPEYARRPMVFDAARHSTCA